jgi:large subunit ribosomal protein L9
MEVILLSDVDKIGLRGEVVSVARGYARNYLLPRKLAEVASPGRVAQIEKREAQRAQQEARTFEQGQKIAEVLGKTVLRFEVKAGPTGALFGSVTPTDIADEIWRTRKIRVDRRKIGIDNIKRIGRYDVPIDVFQDVRVEVKTLVVPEGGELPSDEELEAMVAAERAEQEAAAPAEAPTVEYEYVDEVEAGPTPAEAAAAADEPEPAAELEPEWRADADAALRDADR